MGADRHRRLRAHQGIARARPAARRQDEATKSRTFEVPVETLFDAWADKSVRDRWLDDTDVTVRTATAPKSLRLGLTDGSILAVGFLPKGKTKSSVAVSQNKLPDKETAFRLKEYWSAKLDELGSLLSER